MAADAGAGANTRRQQAVARLLRAARDAEAKFVVRTLVSNLRVGAGWRSVVAPLGRAALIHREGPGWQARLGKKRLDEAGAAAGEIQSFALCFLKGWVVVGRRGQ